MSSLKELLDNADINRVTNKKIRIKFPTEKDKRESEEFHQIIEKIRNQSYNR